MSVFSRGIDWLDAHAPVRAHERADVENDDDAAVAENRRAGDAANTGDLRADRFHDHLAAADQLVGDENAVECSPARTRITGTATSSSGSTRPRAPRNAEVLEAVGLPAVLERSALLGPDALRLRARHTRDAFDGRQRQRVELVARAHDQRLRDRQRERQADDETCAAPRRRLDEQSAAELLHLGGDDVHADAAAGRLRDGARGAEAGLEDELHRLLIRERVTRIHQAHRDGLVADRLDVDAGAVVGRRR